MPKHQNISVLFNANIYDLVKQLRSYKLSIHTDDRLYISSHSYHRWRQIKRNSHYVIPVRFIIFTTRHFYASNSFVQWSVTRKVSHFCVYTVRNISTVCTQILLLQFDVVKELLYLAGGGCSTDHHRPAVSSNRHCNCRLRVDGQLGAAGCEIRHFPASAWFTEIQPHNKWPLC